MHETYYCLIFCDVVCISDLHDTMEHVVASYLQGICKYTHFFLDILLLVASRCRKSQVIIFQLVLSEEFVHSLPSEGIRFDFVSL
jgi:hypothetical protein